MNEQLARKILGSHINGDSLQPHGDHVWWLCGTDVVELDGTFTAVDLEAIVFWMRRPGIGQVVRAVPIPLTLEVGITEDLREVVVNHPDLRPDASGVGHIVFSPEQARAFAHTLLAKAAECKP